MPLELSPDVIYNTILQGISAHVSHNPERYRKIFVSHMGKKELKTRDDTLVRGSWDNKWDRSVQALRTQLIGDMSGEAVKTVLNTTFSTTTIAEATAHSAVFMDAVKNYYDYTVMTMCVQITFFISREK